MSSAIAIFSFSAVLYGLIGLWIQAGLPDRMPRLLEASSQESTSGSIASLYASLYHSMAAAVLSETIAGVLPSASSTLPPKPHSTAQKVVLASPVWLMAMPIGLPCFLRTFPCLSSSSQVLGGSGPAFWQCAML